MYRRILAPAVMMFLLTAAPLLAGWQNDLKDLIKTDNPTKQTELIGKIVQAAPSWSEVAEKIRETDFPNLHDAEFTEHEVTCTDGIDRPYVLYVPGSYNRKQPTPLLVILHGAVTRAELIADRIGYAQQHEMLQLAKSNGWLALFPFGQDGAAWWQPVGMANIKKQIRLVKRDYNIDDDRVWLGGFSDGASAAFGYAMLDPTDFAAFVALNGHMGVDNEDGKLQTYLVNMSNSPVYAVTNFHDALYPSTMMRPTIELAQSVGVDITYHEHEGGHELNYADVEMPLISEWLLRHPRNPIPTDFIWETASAEFGRFRWFAIDEVVPDNPAGWHRDYNTELIDSTIVIGFIPNWDYPGPGIPVEQVLDGNYAAKSIGLLPGDTIIGTPTMKIDNLDDLGQYKATLHRGDSTSLRVKRDGKEVTISGVLPQPARVPLFKYTGQSGAARVTATANRVSVRASGLGDFHLFIDPELFDLTEKLVIEVDGEMVFDELVQPDLEFMLRDFLKNRDRKTLYVAEVKIAR